MDRNLGVAVTDTEDEPLQEFKRLAAAVGMHICQLYTSEQDANHFRATPLSAAASKASAPEANKCNEHHQQQEMTASSYQHHRHQRSAASRDDCCTHSNTRHSHRQHEPDPDISSSSTFNNSRHHRVDNIGSSPSCFNLNSSTGEGPMLLFALSHSLEVLDELQLLIP